MSSSNASTIGNDHRKDFTAPRLAGGMGAVPAKQRAFAQLQRLTCACLLWEDIAYASGKTVTEQIAELIPQCDAQAVADLAVEIRKVQGLRHVPLFMVRELFRIPESRKIAGAALSEVIRRADEIPEFLALYWKGQVGKAKEPLAHQAKKALGRALGKFDEYQLAKWDREGKEYRIRDAMFLAHANPNPENPLIQNAAFRSGTKNGISKVPGYVETEREALYRKLADQELATPETRETLLSASTTPAAKLTAYLTLLSEPGKMGASALLKSLRHMTECGVPPGKIKAAMLACKTERILPIDFISASIAAPQFNAELETLMGQCLKKYTRLPGKSIFVLDVSGSMTQQISSKSTHNRMTVAISMAIMASFVCDSCDIYLTAGKDGYGGKHTTELYNGPKGLGMVKGVQARYHVLGGGGIFTRQALEWIEGVMGKDAKSSDRTIVFSDSQDCDHRNSVPKPFSKKNYIVDISSHKHGINYDGVWTGEVSGWSPQFIEFIAQSEALQQQWQLF